MTGKGSSLRCPEDLIYVREGKLAHELFPKAACKYLAVLTLDKRSHSNSISFASAAAIGSNPYVDGATDDRG